MKKLDQISIIINDMDLILSNMENNVDKIVNILDSKGIELSTTDNECYKNKLKKLLSK